MKRSTASPFWGSEVVILPDMRRRGAQKGYLYEESDQWKLRWWVDTVDTQGNAKRVRSRPWTIGRSKGPGKITKRRAQTIAAEKMAEVNRGGTTTRVTVYDFIVERFTPDHVAGLTGNGRRHYRTVLERHVEPTFGSWELPEIKAQHVIQWLQAKAEAGYSRSHLTHMRNVLHAIYEHAHRCGIYEGRNPAAKIKIPRSAREPEPTQPYTLEELRTILDHLPSPLWEMFVLGASTSMHAAELCGLCIEHVNLSDRPKGIQGKTVPPGSLFVCEALTDAGRTAGKTKLRRRILPIPAILHERLREMIGDRPPRDPVFFMPRSRKTQGGVRPVNSNNITTRTFGPLSKLIGIKVNWHRLRATNATLTSQMLMDDDERRKMMGHGSVRMTERYTDGYVRAKGAAEAIAEGLVREGGSVQ